jgi:hypothetical protein
LKRFAAAKLGTELSLGALRAVFNDLVVDRQVRPPAALASLLLTAALDAG